VNPQSLKRTPLHAAHCALGARMIPFAGWEMPLHYGSQIAEHHAVRRSAGIFDVSHMLAVDCSGSGAPAVLRGLLANDVAKLGQPGKALYSCMLNDAGGVLDDLIVYRLAEAAFRLVVNAATADRDLAWIAAQGARFGSGMTSRPRHDLAMIAIQGPAAREMFWRMAPGARQATEELRHFEMAQIGEMCVARTGYTGEDGFEVMLPAAAAPAIWERLRAGGAAPAGLGARDTLRLEAGLNLYGQDMDETVSPLESGLAWTVAVDAEHDFIGCDSLRRRTPANHLLGLILPERGMLRSGQRVVTTAGEGVITSGGFGPTVNRAIALARLPRAIGTGAAVEVETRGGRVSARVVKPPFVRNGKILVEG
jgi:aminomethyltransferase